MVSLACALLPCVFVCAQCGSPSLFLSMLFLETCFSCRCQRMGTTLSNEGCEDSWTNHGQSISSSLHVSPVFPMDSCGFQFCFPLVYIVPDYIHHLRGLRGFQVAACCGKHFLRWLPYGWGSRGLEAEMS